MVWTGPTSFGERWFAEGSLPTAMLAWDGRDLSADEVELVKQRFLASLRVGMASAVLGSEWKVSPTLLSVLTDADVLWVTRQWELAGGARGELGRLLRSGLT